MMEIPYSCHPIGFQSSNMFTTEPRNQGRQPVGEPRRLLVFRCGFSKGGSCGTNTFGQCNSFPLVRALNAFG